MLNTSIRVHKPLSQCNCVVSKEHIKVVNLVKLLRSELEKARNKVTTLKEFQVLKANVNAITSETLNAKNNNVVKQLVTAPNINAERQSVVTLK